MEFLNPSQIIKSLNLKKNITAADFGSGSGGWTIPLAQELEDGLVYAIDILKEPLSALKSKADLYKIKNIQTIVSDIEEKNGSTLADESVDFVLISNLFFQTEMPKEVFKEAERILKKGGQVLVVDWKKEAPQGPEKGRISSQRVKEMANEIGLRFEKEIEAGKYHYALLFQKT